MTPWTARMGSEGRVMEGGAEKAKVKPWGCSLATRSACARTEPRMEGSREKGNHHSTIWLPTVTAAVGLTSSKRPGRAGGRTLTHRCLLAVVFAGHQLHTSRLQLNLLLD